MDGPNCSGTVWQGIALVGDNPVAINVVLQARYKLGIGGSIYDWHAHEKHIRSDNMDPEDTLS
jgi:hypothetical protein